MIKPLTSLRFFFAFMVFCCHSNLLEKSDNELVRNLYLDVLLEGYIGVSFFFILSGFILSYSYQEKLIDGRRKLLDFFVGRIARIYPLHLVCAIVAVPITVFYQLDQGAVNLILKFLANVTLVHSFVPVESVYMSYNAPDWSISNEMFFYLAFPFLLKAGLCRLKKGKVFFAFLAIFIGVIIGMYCLSESWQHAIFYVNPFVRILDFVLGILLYNMWKYGVRDIGHIKHNLLELLAILVFILFFCFHHLIPQVYRYSVYYWIPMMGIIYVFANQGGFISKWLSHRWLVYLGEISFGFYLIHQLVFRYWHLLNVRIFHLQDEVLQLAIILSISITFAAFSFRYFEQYANQKVKARLSKSPWLTRTVRRLDKKLLK